MRLQISVVELIRYHILQDSVVIGLIIVERCQVVVESEGGNRNAFRLSE